MKKLNKIEISATEREVLSQAQRTIEAMWSRFRHANGGEYGVTLDITLEVKPDIENRPHAWWLVRPSSEFLQRGHSLDIVKALEEMHGHTDADVKLRQAKRYRIEAERLEEQAKQITVALAQQ